MEPSRRILLVRAGGASLGIAAATLARFAVASTAGGLFPGKVAGVVIPDSPLAVAALQLARADIPPLLFNHSIRTFLFGALLERAQGVSFDDEMLFVACAFHDLGLLAKYSTADQPFEMDSADAGKRFLEQRGVPAVKVELVWKAIAMHTSALVAHEAPQVALVGTGAGADVFGSGLARLPPGALADILHNFPRLGFKAGFEALLTDYCHRKPQAQAGTWTDAYCRAHSPGVIFPSIERRIETSPFVE